MAFTKGRRTMILKGLIVVYGAARQSFIKQLNLLLLSILDYSSIGMSEALRTGHPVQAVRSLVGRINRNRRYLPREPRWEATSG